MAHPSWGSPCTGTRKTVVLSNGVRLPVRAELAELIALLCEETMRRGYRLVPGWCWGYACRKIAGSSTWSNHAWALAVDLNAPKNPYTTKLVTDMPPWMPALWKSYGFRWGGDYRGKKDAMHYEFMGSVTDARNQTERARRELGKSAPKPQPTNGLNAGQLKWLAQSVGLTGDDVNIAAAVALAESRLPGSVNPPLSDPRAFNGKAPDASYGPWQINMHGSLGPARRAQFGLRSNDDLYNPATNARAMRQIHREQGWKGWGAFTNGSYKAHLPHVHAAAPQPIGGTELAEEEDMMFFAQAVKDGQPVDYRIWLVRGWERAHVPGPAQFEAIATWPNIRNPGSVAQMSPEALDLLEEVPLWQ